MRTLTERRRALLAGCRVPRIPPGYIRDGLVFFLDGKQQLTPSRWVDCASGKRFSLTNCSVASGGTVLDGTSYGKYGKPVTDDWNTETIEVVFNGITGIKAKTIFYQPMIDAHVGASLRFGDNVSTRVAMAPDGIRRNVFQGAITSASNRISLTADRCVLNGVALSGMSATSYSANQTGHTYLGCHRFTPDGSIGGRYVGIIHAIRIYNRKLTQDEMVSNQQNDVVYYGNS